MNNHRIMSGLLGLALTAVTAQAAAPSLSYEISGNELIISYTGTLLRSSDAVNWTEVVSASSPYKIALSDKKLFFCAKASDEPVTPILPGQDVTITLPEGVKLDLIWISPGTFMMGSPEGELGGGGDEILHQVTLTRGYWLGKYEVTQAQYEAIMGENPSRFKGTDQPVESVSWNDAMAFCEKLTEREQAAGRLLKGYEYTLPTEAQWEYACRAGTMTAFNNGTNIETDDQVYGECPNLDPLGWYWCNSESKTHPVGQKQPNDWGLYDMHGNVFEWCLDAKNRYPTTPVVDPVQEDIEPYYAVRGGSYSYYDDGAKRCRSAARSVRLNTSTSMSLGFRVALVKKGNKDTLVITLDDTKTYDGAPLTSSYTKAVVTGLMPGDSLISGAVQTSGVSVGSYKYPVSSGIITPFETTMGIENYDVVYVINQTITRIPLTITINDTKTYDGTPLVSSYSVALASGLQGDDKLTAGAVTSAGSKVGSYSYPDTSTITTPFRTTKGIENYDVTYVINQTITVIRIPLTITINDTKAYDGNPLISSYTKAVVTGLMPGDSLISGAVQTYGPSAGSYKYPVSSGILLPFETTMGIENYNVTYVINQTITIIRVPLTITINDSKLYDGTPLVSGYSDAVASGLLDGDKLIAGAVTSASSEIGSYSYPDTSTITTPFRTAKGISNYDVTYNIKQSITEKISPGANITITLLNNENLKMIWIEPGTFIMGSPEDELGRWADETQHQVTLTKGYWMGQYAICTGYNWYQATNYCAELTAQEREAGRLPEGYEYTLPTEAQWEYACRAGTTTALNSGKNLSNWNTCPEMDEVRQESSNAWGLYNMHGHRYEWCLDWYEADYPTEPVIDPTGPSTGKFRVIRGGCYLNLADRCRSAFRYISTPDTKWDGCGFRLVLAPVK